MASFKPSADIIHMEGLGLESNVKTCSEDSVFYYQRGLNGIKADTPILVLIHGYPQSNFMWRHVVPLLPPTTPLFIPDLPGYGRSAPLPGPHSKRAVGKALLRSLSPLLPTTRAQPLIIAGHDRGARVCHRLAVDGKQNQQNYPNVIIKGTILLDIVPTIVQWQTFGDPIAAARGFHWPLLANVELATALIMARGGDEWTRECLRRWVGKSEVGGKHFEDHGAVEVYAESFKLESVVRASCDDYRAGAEEDIEEQKMDQESGKKLYIPTLLIYSKDYIGKRYDMVKVWGEWIEDDKLLEEEAIGDGIGHFIAEEAPQKTAAAISKFYAKFV